MEWFFGTIIFCGCVFLLAGILSRWEILNGIGVTALFISCFGLVVWISETEPEICTYVIIEEGSKIAEAQFIKPEGVGCYPSFEKGGWYYILKGVNHHGECPGAKQDRSSDQDFRNDSFVW